MAANSRMPWGAAVPRLTPCRQSDQCGLDIGGQAVLPVTQSGLPPAWRVQDFLRSISKNVAPPEGALCPKLRAHGTFCGVDIEPVGLMTCRHHLPSFTSIGHIIYTLTIHIITVAATFNIMIRVAITFIAFIVMIVLLCVEFVVVKSIGVAEDVLLHSALVFRISLLFSTDARPHRRRKCCLHRPMLGL